MGLSKEERDKRFKRGQQSSREAIAAKEYEFRQILRDELANHGFEPKKSSKLRKHDK